MIGRIFNKVKELGVGLMFGMEKANEQMLRQCDGSMTAPDSGHHKIQESNTLLEALLRGEVTEEVQEFRYSHYKVLAESEKYRLSASDAMRLASLIEEHEILTKTEGNQDRLREISQELLKIRTKKKEGPGYDIAAGDLCFTQRVKPVAEGVGELLCGQVFDEVFEYNVTVKYDGFPLKRIENYLYSVTVDEVKKRCTFTYFEKQYNQKGSGLFVAGLKRIGMELPGDVRKYKNSIGDVVGLSFRTDRAIGINDHMFVEVNGLKYNPETFDYKHENGMVKYTMEFDECLVESLDPRIIYFNEAMEKKYAEKTAKKQKMSITRLEDFRDPDGLYKCTICGKPMAEDEVMKAFAERGWVICDECAAFNNNEQSND